jgi:hypothetical protein
MRAAKTNNPETGATKQPSSNVERQSGATTLIDAYPNDFVVQYMMPTTVSQFIKLVNHSIYTAVILTRINIGHY